MQDNAKVNGRFNAVLLSVTCCMKRKLTIKLETSYTPFLFCVLAKIA